MIEGLTGEISDLHVAIPAATAAPMHSPTDMPKDIDLVCMAEWSMNYLIHTPRAELNYQPVFQCHPLRCPPVPSGNDVVVNCDTDARLDPEWYFMREISGSGAGRDVEAAFHRRIRGYIEPDGGVWSHPGCYSETKIDAVYGPEDYVFHTWGATKILKSLSEEYARTGDDGTLALARKVMRALRRHMTWDGEGRCYSRCGMGGLRRDGAIVPNGWNQQPAPIVEPLVTYFLATGDHEGLEFAIAYARGMMDNIQPGGIRFESDGSFAEPLGHSHATMHAVWGVARLGLVTGDSEYVDFAKRCWDWMLSRGTGTGWFPAGPDNCNETCCISDMMSVAACIAEAGHTQYYDYVERYLRNYVNTLQFIVTDEFAEYYRRCNASSSSEEIEKGLQDLRGFQGGIIGGSGLNDWENDLLGGRGGFEMLGCCAPEGMRAIYTTWSNTISRLPASALGPAGVYVNVSFSRQSPWGEVVSFMPDEGRLTVKSAVTDTFFLRPPHWASRRHVHAFVNARPVPTEWSGAHVRLEASPDDELTITYPMVRFCHRVGGLWESCAPNLVMTFQWLGNMVVAADPPPTKTPLFTGRPRVLPQVAEAHPR